MTKQEFKENVEHFTGLTASVSDCDYGVIEFVYNFYPTISETQGKMEIARIYAYGGMTVIYDMVARAKKAQELECQIASLRSQIEALVLKADELKRGVLHES